MCSADEQLIIFSAFHDPAERVANLPAALPNSIFSGVSFYSPGSAGVWLFHLLCNSAR
jgi:hypothetical protein